MTNNPYQQYFEESEDGILIFDKDRKIVDVNTNALKLLRREKKELMGASVNESFQSNDVYEKIVAGFKEKDYVTNLQESYVTQDNEIIVLLISAKQSSNGGYVLLKDITRLKEMENKVQLEQSMNLLGIMAKGIAHDFNNLLMGISGSLNLLILDSKNLTASQRKFLFDAQKALFQATGLVKQFQYLTREDKPKNIKIDLYSAVKNVFTFLDRTSSKVVEKQINFEPNHLFVYADPVKLNQVFLNLANNSINAMGPVTAEKTNFIKVSAIYSDGSSVINKGLSQDSKYVHLVFEDNAKEIPMEQIDKIFMPFYSTEEKDEKGFMRGLGLPITYDIITRQFKGSIEIESDSVSTKVHIFLPGIPSESDQVRTADDIRSEVLPTGTETILIADDEQVVRNVLSVTLQKLGYTINAVTNGEDCVKVYKSHRDEIDLVLLDITMPKMSGVEVMAHILDINPNAKIVISSGHTEEEIHQGILDKAQGHLNKPYERNELAQIIRQVLDKK